MLMLAISSGIGALLILQAVTFWHKQDTTRAFLYVFMALFGLSLMITGTVVSYTQAQQQQAAEQQELEDSFNR